MFKFTPRQIPQTLVVIGCGGTGSRLVPMLAQFIRSITRSYNSRGWLEEPTVYLVDDDVVEHKNLLRQNFIEADVGKNKAVVLAQRYSRAFGVRIIPAPVRAGTVNKGTLGRASLLGSTEGCPSEEEEHTVFGSNCIYLLCVDSAEARRKILTTIESTVHRCVHRGTVNDYNVPFVIDAGNEDNFGQVNFFSMGCFRGDKSKVDKLTPPMTPVIGDIPFIPYPKAWYTNMRDNQSTASCADLDQTLAINASMATTMLGIVQNFYYVKPFTFNCINISLEGGNSTVFNTKDNIASRMVTSSSGISINGVDVIRGWFEANLVKISSIEKAAREARLAQEAAEKEAIEKAKAEEDRKIALVTQAAESPVTADTAEPEVEQVKPKRKTSKKEAVPELVPLTALTSSAPPLVPLRSRGSAPAVEVAPAPTTEASQEARDTLANLLVNTTSEDATDYDF